MHVLVPLILLRLAPRHEYHFECLPLPFGSVFDNELILVSVYYVIML